MTQPYFEFHGLKCGGLIQPKQHPRGGLIKSDKVLRPGQDRADIYNGGRDASQYPWKATLKSEDALEKLLAVVNTAPPYAEFYPFREDRCIYVDQASARTSQADIASIDGAPGYLYQADLQLEASEARCYGPEKGIGYQQNVTVKGWTQSQTLTNNGCFANGLDYLMLSGGYNENECVSNTMYSILSPSALSYGYVSLCQKHLIGDKFVLDRFGNCEHSYNSNFSCTYESLQRDLWGASYCSGGEISPGGLVIGNDGKGGNLMFPFVDNLPATYGYLDIDVTWLAGQPLAVYGTSAAVSHPITTVRVGRQRIYLPSAIQGNADVAMGIYCKPGDKVTLTHVNAVVCRYIAPSMMPQVPPGESFVIGLACNGGRNFNALHISYRDSYPI